MSQYQNLADLKRISTELKEKARAAEEERRIEAQKRLAGTEEAREFRAAMADLGVSAWSGSNRIERKTPRKGPTPKGKALREALEAEEAAGSLPGSQLSDEEECSGFLEEEGLFFRRDGVSPDIPKKLRRGEWTVQARLDLHGLFVDEAREVFDKFVNDCRIRGFRCFSVVHGKGIGSVGGQSVLREMVPRWVRQCEDVMAYAQAAPGSGGSGALIVLLSRPQRKDRFRL